jgi:hypothetical protein
MGDIDWGNTIYAHHKFINSPVDIILTKLLPTVNKNYTDSLIFQKIKGNYSILEKDMGDLYNLSYAIIPPDDIQILIRPYGYIRFDSKNPLKPIIYIPLSIEKIKELLKPKKMDKYIIVKFRENQYKFLTEEEERNNLRIIIARSIYNIKGTDNIIIKTNGEIHKTDKRKGKKFENYDHIYKIDDGLFYVENTNINEVNKIVTKIFKT